jgi:quinol monooxygenase YgiN
MSLLVHAEIHGLAGRAADLRELLQDHARGMAAAEGGLGAAVYEPVGAETGELVLQVWWRDEAALRAHYATSEYTRYFQRVGELLARPSDVTVHAIERSYRATGDLSADPARQG